MLKNLVKWHVQPNLITIWRFIFIFFSSKIKEESVFRLYDVGWLKADEEDFEDMNDDDDNPDGDDDGKIFLFWPRVRSPVLFLAKKELSFEKDENDNNAIRIRMLEWQNRLSQKIGVLKR